MEAGQIAIPVVDNFGEVRGVVHASPDTGPIGSELIAGRPADPVYSDNGDIAGYFFLGPVGFLDTASSNDPETWACLDAASNAASKSESVPSECIDRLKTLGFGDGVGYVELSPGAVMVTPGTDQ